MGANAQTSVPTFTAGEVLTAANMNISARTGIPVFADSTARDAAFGGTGEKTLAEGQFAYLESTNATQYYDGSTWQSVASNKVVQIVTGNTSTEATNSTSTFADTNLTATITPTSASNNILVQVTQQGLAKSSANAGNAVNLRLVRGSTTIQTFADAYGYDNTLTGLYLGGCATNYLDSPATTSATTYKTQFCNDTNTASVRVQADGVANSYIVLMEVTP